MKKYLTLEYISISIVFVTLFGLIKTYFYWLEYPVNIFYYLEPGEVIFTSTNSLLAIALIFLSAYLPAHGHNTEEKEQKDLVENRSIALAVGAILMLISIAKIYHKTTSDIYFTSNFSFIVLWLYLYQKLIDWGWRKKINGAIIFFVVIYSFIALNNFIEKHVIAEKEIEIQLIDNSKITSEESSLIGETKNYIFLQDKKTESVKIINKENVLTYLIKK